MEDSEMMNAGLGSNLTFNGIVECDASIMEGNGNFGAIAAVTGVKNPIGLASRLIKEQRKGLSNGRIPPMYTFPETLALA